MTKKKDNNITVIFDSIKGENRPSNQDDILIIDIECYYLFFLFDGVSSINTSIDFIAECKSYILDNYIRFFENKYFRLADLLYQTNKNVTRDGAYGMSTCSAIYIDKENLKAFAVNIGDSRIYTYTNQFLECVTKDDLLPGTTNVLTKCMGDLRLTVADFVQREILLEQGVLLCSDGFYKVMEEKRLRFFSIFNFKRTNNIKNSLKNEVIGRNQDDSTYIIIRKNGI